MCCCQSYSIWPHYKQRLTSITIQSQGLGTCWCWSKGAAGVLLAVLATCPFIQKAARGLKAATCFWFSIRMGLGADLFHGEISSLDSLESFSFLLSLLHIICCQWNLHCCGVGVWTDRQEEPILEILICYPESKLSLLALQHLWETVCHCLVKCYTN